MTRIVILTDGGFPELFLGLPGRDTPLIVEATQHEIKDFYVVDKEEWIKLGIKEPFRGWLQGPAACYAFEIGFECELADPEPEVEDVEI